MVANSLWSLWIKTAQTLLLQNANGLIVCTTRHGTIRPIVLIMLQLRVAIGINAYTNAAHSITTLKLTTPYKSAANKTRVNI